jgi:hypothetical protein
MYHPSMKSMARLDASSLDLERENGTNQCETKVIPIFPFWTACIIYHLEYEVFYCSLMKSMARLDASSLDLERENGTNQCETKVIPIFPFWLFTI